MFPLQSEVRMNKEALVRKMEEGVASVRDLLKQNNGSTLQAISNSVKHGFDSLKTAFTQNELAQKAVTEIRAKFDDLEKAVISGDKELSDKLLKAVEKKIKEYKARKNAARKSKKVIELPPAAKDVRKAPAAKKAAPAKKVATAQKPTASTKAAPSKKAPAAQKVPPAKKTATSKAGSAAKKPAAKKTAPGKADAK